MIKETGIYFKDLYGDNFKVAAQGDNFNEILFSVESEGNTCSGVLDINQATELRDFLNQFIEVGSE